MSAVGTPRLPEPTRRPHRWRSAVAGFPTLLGTSTANALFSILGKPITEEFGWDRGGIAVPGFPVDRDRPRAALGLRPRHTKSATC